MTEKQKKRQIWNPYLPLDEYISDGEPHVFGKRIYVFGSHDQENSITFCMRDYVVWSAPEDDLTDWSNTGVVYRAEQDPLYDPDSPDHRIYMYAPDVVQGNDGRFYLYYCMAGMQGHGGYANPISVAVADKPDGEYTYLGVVHDAEGAPLKKYVCFDPAVINDEGTIRLYYGTYYEDVDRLPEPAKSIAEEKLFSRSREQIKAAESWTTEDGRQIAGGIMGAMHVELADDMLTAKTQPVKISDDEFRSSGHSFFEASSIRKICFTDEMPLEATQVGGDFGKAPDPQEVEEPARKSGILSILRRKKRGVSEETDQELAARLRGTALYYFIYSSKLNHELCYAVSPYPDHGFTFGGTIVSNGDIGYGGRKASQRLNHTGNNHGSIEEINGQWYVFYHRQTDQSNYSRQGCAEPIQIRQDGRIDQVEITSSGLNLDPLDGGAEGPVTYPAIICCNLSNGKMKHAANQIKPYHAPKIMNRHLAKSFEEETGELTALGTTPIYGNVTREEVSGNTIERFIGQIAKHTVIGYKYFFFKGGTVTITVRLRGTCEGQLYLCTDVTGDAQEVLDVHQSANWKRYTAAWEQKAGVAPLYLWYEGSGEMELLDFTLG